MQNQPISISIITPVFNGIQFIEACIQNIINQECDYAEHIIIDGGSTDGSVKVIESYAKKYSHIKWLSERDSGQSDAMNKGIGMATSPIISFLNIDDFYEENTLNRVIHIFENLPKTSFLVGNCKIWDSEGKVLAYNKVTGMTFCSVYSCVISGKFSEFINAFPVNPSCYFYHKCIHDQVGLYDTQDHYTMDFDFILRLLLSPYIHVEYRDENWGNYRQIAGTKTFNQNTLGNTRSNLIKVLEKQSMNLPLSTRIKMIPFLYRMYTHSKRKFLNSIIKLFSLPIQQV